METAAVQTRAGVFHRVRVNLSSVKPLTRFVPLALEGRERVFLQIQYEKIPKHCEHCGLMSHTYLECGSGEYEEADLQFGPWMLADETSWKRGTHGARTWSSGRSAGDDRGYQSFGGRGGTRGAGVNRGGGTGGRNGPDRMQHRWIPRGGASNSTRKRNSAEAGLANPDELKDTAESPLKEMQDPDSVNTNKSDSGERKQLDMDGAAEGK